RIYLADRSNGIAWFDVHADNAALQYLDNRQGINSSSIEQIIADNDDNIWFSTAFGISRYRASENSFNNYSYYSYALGNASPPTLCFSSQSNTLYIGQSNSVNFFNTSQVKTPGNLNIIFIGLKIFNEPLHVNGRPLADGGQMKLNYRENTISVEFALLSYSNSGENRYTWKLDGLEEDWHVSYDNEAYYANLNPGKYTLVVKAANSNGVWSKEIKLLIEITPPFYKTWWFMLLLVLAVAGIIYYGVQLRINRIKEKFRLRNKIAADLHDEIGSTLTSISILSNVSQQAMEQQPQQAKEMLQQISTQSKKVQQNMSDIVWSIRPDNEKIENLITRMREYAAQTLEPLDIKITIEADENTVNKILPMECRKELLLIYKEAINNIAKHAGATEVIMSLTIGNRQIHLNIADNGNWKGYGTGTGTKSMKERAIAIGGNLTITVKESGTVVSVIIPVP
ncbi:MAG: triple tyrosine motif-containing protein, partial [Ferruginibacter sp.]